MPVNQRDGDGATRTIGIGLIGTGFMGGIHARAYGSVPWIFPSAVAQPALRVVADARLEDAEAFARRFGIPEWTDDWRSLLDRSDLELIDVCTPPVPAPAHRDGHRRRRKAPLLRETGRAWPRRDAGDLGGRPRGRVFSASSVSTTGWRPR